MRAMQAVGFSGHQDLVVADIPKPSLSGGKVLVRMTAAGVTPLDHTILSGHFPMAKAPLVLGNEGAGIVEEGGDERFPNGSRVMFTGPYGVFENGTYCEWLAVRKEHMCRIPDNITDTAAAGLPVAYLTAHMALAAAGFAPGKTVLAPAIGGSVGNAVTQLAMALGARHSLSTTTSRVKAERARELGFSHIVDLSAETLTAGVTRLTDGAGVDVVIDSIGGNILSEALGVVAQRGTLVTLGYAGGRKSTIDVTDLIWKTSAVRGFLLFAEPVSAWEASWRAITALLVSNAITPIVAKVFPLEEARDALLHLMEDRPFGRVILKM